MVFKKQRKLPKISKAQDLKTLQAKRQIPWTMQPAPCQLA
jgi:hypothetical protein